MGFADKVTKKSLGFWLALAASVVALVGLIVYFAYIGKGGIASAGVIIPLIGAIACGVGLFFYNGTFADLLPIAAAVMTAIALGVSLSDGVGNIADYVSNIVMYGDADLAGLNFAMVAIFAVGVLLYIVSCFMKKERTA